LTGLIPSELGRLPKLEDIRLRKLFTSGLDTIIPLGSVLHFISPTVVVDENDLTGSIPSELGGLTTLVRIDLCKFATVSGSELDMIKLLGSLSYKLSRLRFCSRKSVDRTHP
jgi:hypothetical protein